MRTDLNNLMKISIIACMILISLSVSYYFIVYLPSQERMRTQKTEQKELERNMNEYQRKIDLDSCLADAGEVYITTWNSNCKSRGRKDDCSLPLALVESVNKEFRYAKEECFKRYSKTE